MKRFICLILAFVFLLAGCHSMQNRSSDIVDFYYLRVFQTEEDHAAYFSDGAITSEQRDVSGHREDLTYLLTMYLRGPLDSHLVSPFPTGCSLIGVQQDGSELTVQLSSGASLLNDLDLSIACGCLAQTCMSLADVDTVHIKSLSTINEVLFSITLTADSLLLEVTQPEEPQ